MAKIDGSGGTQVIPPELGSTQDAPLVEGDVVQVKPTSYLGRLQQGIDEPLPLYTALRERVTLVIPPREVVPQLTPLSSPETETPELSTFPEPQVDEEKPVFSEQPESVSVSDTSNVDRSQAVYDEYKALVLATNEFIESHGAEQGVAVHLNQGDLQASLSAACQELGISDLSQSPEPLELFERYITTRLQRQGVEVAPYETREAALEFGDPELEKGKEAEKLLQNEAQVVASEVAIRPEIKAAPLPEKVKAVLDNGLQSQNYAELSKAKKEYYDAVILYCQEYYGDDGVPPELQEAFYKGMLELAVHGSYLEKTDFEIKGSSSRKPKHKKRLAMVAASIREVRKTKNDLPGGMVGSTMNALTNRTLIQDAREADYLFGHCMGFELVSGKELALPLKKTMENLRMVTDELKTAPEGSEQRRKLEERRSRQLEKISEVQEQMADLESRRRAGHIRSNDDLWRESYALLDERMTDFMKSSIQEYYEQASTSWTKAAFLSEKAIFDRIKSQLKAETRKSVNAYAKKLKTEEARKQAMNNIMQDKADGIQAILREAVSPLKEKIERQKPS